MILRSFTTTLLVGGLSVGVATDGEAQSPRDGLFVSTGWLAEHADDASLVLLHVGRPEGYEQEHIPGAHFLPYMDLRHPDSHSSENLILELPEPDQLQEMLRGWGINDDSRIVVYWGDDWVTPTARTVFTLDWAGLGDRTVVLDGGLPAWKAAGNAVSTETPTVARGKVTVRPQQDLVVDATWVQAHGEAPGYGLVDARVPEFYAGEREDRGKYGHIPGAGSTPGPGFVTEDLLLKSPGEIRKIFADAGVAEGDTVVAYCHIGQYATMAILAARTLGYDVKLYDGSFQDWARRDLPTERP